MQVWRARLTGGKRAGYNSLSGKSYGNIYDISSPQDQEEKDPRVSHTDELSGRAFGNQEEKGEGTETSVGVSPRKGYASLTRKRDFKDVFDHGSRSSSPYLVIYAQPNGLPFSRLGLSVGRKVGCAVQRNRVKRRIRAAVRAVLQSSQLRCDMVIVARAAAETVPFAELEKAISRGISRMTNEKRADRTDKAV